jgi:hypothetical protein
MSNTNKSSSWNTQTLNIRTTTNFNTAAAAAVNSGLVTISRGGGGAADTGYDASGGKGANGIIVLTFSA